MTADQTSEIRGWLLGFLATLAFLSVGLNLYLGWKVYGSKVLAFVGSFSSPAPVTSADHVRWPGGAGTTVIIYSDFQCPFCRRLYGSLAAAHDKQPFMLVYRHFPLPGHPNAEQFAEASECAADQGKFWEFADALYAADPQPKDAEGLSKMAASLGMDASSFAKCIGSPAAAAKVAHSRAEGEHLGIIGTPTYFVNGRRYQGAGTEEQLRALLSSAGAGSGFEKAP
ncbi:MAG TPA: DsbA family protein [Gammaproteobacteria bacterium]|nr:DsbA family protein [Gammaproteobacteria bacterium]